MTISEAFLEAVQDRSRANLELMTTLEGTCPAWNDGHHDFVWTTADDVPPGRGAGLPAYVCEHCGTVGPEVDETERRCQRLAEAASAGDVLVMGDERFKIERVQRGPGEFVTLHLVGEQLPVCVYSSSLLRFVERQRPIVAALRSAAGCLAGVASMLTEVADMSAGAGENVVADWARLAQQFMAAVTDEADTLAAAS